MRNISQEAIDLFNKDYRQVVRIHFSKGDTAFDITEADIIQGGMTIDRYCVSGSKIEVGSAVAAELTLRLRNYDGKFDAVSFEGATLTVEVGIKKWDALAWEKAQLHWVPCGQFIIDTPPRTLDTISISALDRMVLFDKEVDAESKRASAEATRNTAEETRAAEHQQAMADCRAAVANVQLVTAPFYIVDADNHKNYVASLQVVNGKPVMIYEEKE